MPIIRSDQALITVVVTSVTIDAAAWDKLEGGDNVAESVEYFPGGMAPQVALGGLPKRSDLTVARAWSDTLQAAYKALDAGVGRLRVTVSYQSLGADKVPIGTPMTYTGILKSAVRPNYDSLQSREAQMQLTVSLDGPVS